MNFGIVDFSDRRKIIKNMPEKKWSEKRDKNIEIGFDVIL